MGSNGFLVAGGFYFYMIIVLVPQSTTMTIQDLAHQDEFVKELRIFVDSIPAYRGNRTELSYLVSKIIEEMSHGKLLIAPHNKRQYESQEDLEEQKGSAESSAGSGTGSAFNLEFLPTAIKFFQGVQGAVGNLRLNTTSFFQTAQSIVPKAIRPQIAGVFKIINNKVLEQWATTIRPSLGNLDQNSTTQTSLSTTRPPTIKTTSSRPNKINDFEVEDSEEDYSG